MIRYAKLNLAIDIAPVQNEMRQLNTNWLPHFQSKHYTGEWEVLALRAPGGNSNAPYAELRDGNTFQDTKLMAHCPEIKKILDTFECEKLAVRVLNLKAGAVVKEHKDNDLCFEKGEVRLHIPVFTNSGVDFFVDNMPMKMQEGECWYVNVNLPHRLNNNSDTDRIHIVFDCAVNDWLISLFNDRGNEVSILREAEIWYRNKNEKLNIIQSLRLQNTARSLQMADEMERKLNEYIKELER
jgi:hypothetical protein